MWPRLSKLHPELLFLLLLFAAAGSLILPVPFTRDQGIYAYTAWSWLNEAVPYRDTFDHKGPLLYAVYAFFLPLSKGAMWGINLADLMARIATVAATYFAVLALNDRRTARLAAFFAALPLAAVFTSCWWNAQAETFMMPFLALSAGLAVSTKWPRSSRGLAGILTAQAVMLKSTALLHAFFIIVYLVMRPRPRGLALTRWPALHFVAGLAAGLLPWLSYFYSQGALRDMWESLVVFNTFHAGMQPGLGPKETALLALRGLWTVCGLLLVLCAVPLVRWMRGKRDEGLGFAVGWFLSALAQVVVQEKFFLYHWLVLVPPLGLLAGQGWVRGLGWFTGEKAAYRYLRFGLPAILVTAVIAQGVVFARLYLGVQMHYRTLRYLKHKISPYEYYSRFSEEDYAGFGDFNFLASYLTALYIREHSQPEDCVLVFGYEPLVNYLSARRAPTRYHSDYPLTFQARGERAQRFREQARWRFMNDLNNHPPRYIILVKNDRNALEPKDSFTQAQEFKEFREFLREHYQEAKTIQDFLIFAREAL